MKHIIKQLDFIAKKINEDENWQGEHTMPLGNHIQPLEFGADAQDWQNIDDIQSKINEIIVVINAKLLS